ncbi:MAG: hypothetical protein Aurels2KO_40870 [Aureliella sp.]
MIRLAALCFSLTMLIYAGEVSAASPPNVIIILADDLGYGDLGCYGNELVPTPNMDSLARHGRRFTNAYSPSSVCSPSRYNLMTGRYAWRTWLKSGTIWAYDPLVIEPDRFTLADLFKAQQYRTALIGKWHLGFGDRSLPGWSDDVGPDYNGKLSPGPNDVGFDYFWGFPHVGQKPHVLIENDRVLGLDPSDPLRILPDPRPEYRLNYLSRSRVGAARLGVEGGGQARYQHNELSDVLTKRAVEYIRDQSAEQPFFLCLAHRNVHGPLIPAARFAGKSQIGTYGDFLMELDESVGKVLQAVEQQGLASNTLVLLTSDNGGVVEYRPLDHPTIRGHSPNGSLRGQKTSVYEGGVRVPLLARWPGVIEGGTQDDSLVALTDLLATFADYFESPLPPDAGEDSFSFLGPLVGKESEESSPSEKRTSVICDSFTGMMAIRLGPWKLIQSQNGGGAGTQEIAPQQDLPPAQLFHLDDDPTEATNLYETRSDVVARLTQELSDALMRPTRTLTPE